MSVKIKVIKDEEKPEPTPVLAAAIIKIGEAMESLKKSGLNEEAVVVLLHDMAFTKARYGGRKQIPKVHIRLIFESLRKLKAWYCK